MSKKWLYSVALGTLLVAGDAMGITVHEVLSHDFWSKEQKGTEFYLQQNCEAKEQRPTIKKKI